uniref:Protein-tyrosine-phosphatase n=1 Tax=Arcella intermedia TaxID=1963864 RepID=A0A6B2L7K0_9EUKA
MPAEETRVRLRGKDGPEGYINANGVDLGVEMVGGERAWFICAQAPTDVTVPDHWEMIFQYKSAIICNLTTTEQADHYWPTRKQPSKQFGHFSTTHVETFKFKKFGFKIYQLLVSRDSNEPRTAFVVHFYKWPDHGVPLCSSGLRQMIKTIAYLKHLASLELDLKGPLIVHCLAGVGRTGTFTALYTLMESLKFKDLVGEKHFVDFVENYKLLNGVTIPGYNLCASDSQLDSFLHSFGVFDVVYSLRCQRNNRMVQTEEQYLFIYKSLKDELLNPTVSSKSITLLKPLAHTLSAPKAAHTAPPCTRTAGKLSKPRKTYRNFYFTPTTTLYPDYFDSPLNLVTLDFGKDLYASSSSEIFVQGNIQ